MSAAIRAAEDAVAIACSSASLADAVAEKERARRHDANKAPRVECLRGRVMYLSFILALMFLWWSFGRSLIVL